MKNRTGQLIFQSFYCALALVGIFGSVGFFKMQFSSDFYVYFTNLCNYLCAGLMLAELIQTARRSGDGYVSTAPRLKFMSLLGMILTFLVFNLLLARDPARDPALNFAPECVICHIVLPIMYLLDWLLCYEHGKVNWKLPVLSALFPLVYLIFVLIHAALLHFDASIMNYAGTDPVIYPYFFLNPQRVGAGGIAMWCGALLAAFVLGGFILMGIDRAMGGRKKR